MPHEGYAVRIVKLVACLVLVISFSLSWLGPARDYISANGYLSGIELFEEALEDEFVFILIVPLLATSYIALLAICLVTIVTHIRDVSLRFFLHVLCLFLAALGYAFAYIWMVRQTARFSAAHFIYGFYVFTGALAVIFMAAAYDCFRNRRAFAACIAGLRDQKASRIHIKIIRFLFMDRPP